VATFHTHLTVGLSVAGLAVTTALITGLAGPLSAVVYLGLGTLGSLMPDLDSDNSVPTRVGLTLLAITLAFAAVFLAAHFSKAPFVLAATWVFTYLFLRTVVFMLLLKFTVHRGIFHSIPAVVLVGLATTVIAAHLPQRLPVGHISSTQAWVAGLFTAGGYLTHLILDEIYSVDFANRRIRRSFGTAIKFWFQGSTAASVFVYLACLALVPFVPNPRPLLKHFSHRAHRYSQVQQIPARGFDVLLSNTGSIGVTQLDS
jgi:hypothetical protein